jgi:hypothetical protein
MAWSCLNPKDSFPQLHYLGYGNSLLKWDMNFILITVKILHLPFPNKNVDHRMEKNVSRS